MNMTPHERELIRRLGFDRAEVCVILELCRNLLKHRRYDKIVETVRLSIDHGGYSLDGWKIDRKSFLQKINQIDEAAASAIINGFDRLDRDMPAIFDDALKRDMQNRELNDTFSLAGFE